MKFKKGDLVVHVKTRNNYGIKEIPRIGHLLEYNMDTYYVYSTGKGSFIRCRTEMEDGRFDLVAHDEDIPR